MKKQPLTKSKLSLAAEQSLGVVSRYRPQNIRATNRSPSRQVEQEWGITSHYERLKVDTLDRYGQTLKNQSMMVAPSSTMNITLPPNHPLNARVKQIMPKLTLPRLRKIQALVRGFLVRRKIYPPLLAQYIVAQSVLETILHITVSRQTSKVIMETLTYAGLDDPLPAVGNQSIVCDLIFSTVLERIAKEWYVETIKVSLAQTAMFVSRPQQTFGYNVRDPIQLMLFEKTHQICMEMIRESAQAAIKEESVHQLQLQLMDEWIYKFSLVRGLIEEILVQGYTQVWANEIGSQIMARVQMEGTEAVCSAVVEEFKEKQSQQVINQLSSDLGTWLLQNILCEQIFMRQTAMANQDKQKGL